MDNDIKYNYEDFFDIPKPRQLTPEELGDIDKDTWMKALPPEHRKKLRKEYREWFIQKKDSDVTRDEVYNSIMSDLTFLSSMPVEEYTLYRKWQEIYKWKFASLSRNNVEHDWFNGDETPDFQEVEDLKKEIWIPNDVDDYKNLKPEIILCNDKKDETKFWNIFRVFTHTQLNNSNIGRNLYFLVKDTVSDKYLGLINVSSDFMDLTPRDKYIGWSKEVKTSKRMINHTAIASTILPMQPLGYHYLGGKLMALLSVSDFIVNSWNDRYDTEKIPSKLVGMTTTSLYSSFSQYNNLKHWLKKGHSSGSIKFEVSKETLIKIKEYLQKKFPLQYWEWYHATEPQGMPLKRDFKQRSLSFIYSEFGIEKKYFETNHSRGIYFCPLYENMKEYLRMEITEDKLISRSGFKTLEIKVKDEDGKIVKKPFIENSVENLTEMWKEKYAFKRVEKFKAENREFDFSTLFYDDLVRLSWDETKEKYLKDVGR